MKKISKKLLTEFSRFFDLVVLMIFVPQIVFYYLFFCGKILFKNPD